MMNIKTTISRLICKIICSSSRRFKLSLVFFCLCGLLTLSPVNAAGGPFCFSGGESYVVHEVFASDLNNVDGDGYITIDASSLGILCKVYPNGHPDSNGNERLVVGANGILLSQPLYSAGFKARISYASGFSVPEPAIGACLWVPEPDSASCSYTHTSLESLGTFVIQISGSGKLPPIAKGQILGTMYIDACSDAFGGCNTAQWVWLMADDYAGQQAQCTIAGAESIDVDLHSVDVATLETNGANTSAITKLLSVDCTNSQSTLPVTLKLSYNPMQSDVIKSVATSINNLGVAVKYKNQFMENDVSINESFTTGNQDLSFTFIPVKASTDSAPVPGPFTASATLTITWQ